jgi:hypothetical protein
MQTERIVQTGGLHQPTSTYPLTTGVSTIVSEGTQYTPVQHGPTIIHRPAIVQEQVHRKVVEEVQPILYREVYQPVVIEHIRPVHESIQEPPRVYQDQTPLRDLGIRTIYPQEQKVSTGLQQLPTRMISPQVSQQFQREQFIQQAPLQSGQLPGNIVKVEYEVKGMGLPMAPEQPYVERTLYKEVPLSVLQGGQQGFYSSGAEWGQQQPMYSQGYLQPGMTSGQTWGTEQRFLSTEQRLSPGVMGAEQRFMQPQYVPVQPPYSTQWAQPVERRYSTGQQFTNLGQQTVGSGGFVRTPSTGKSF